MKKHLLLVTCVVGLMAYSIGLSQDVFMVPVMSSNTVTVLWRPSVDDDGEAGLAGYNVYQKTEGSSGAKLVASVGANDTCVTFEVDVKRYYETSTFYVTAYDYAGNESGPSNAATTICHNGPAVLFGDINKDGIVDVVDWFDLKWSEGWMCSDQLPGYREDADLMPDCVIDIEDRFILKNNMGETYRESN